MSQIKLNAASGGGSVALEGPASLGSDKVIKFPNSPNVVTQVISTTKSNAFTTSSSSFTDITGLSAAITPTSSTSKILVMAVVQYSTAGSGGSRQAGRIVRDSTAIGVGDSDGNRVQSSFSSETSGGGGNMKSATIILLDSPSTTSAVTYKVQAAAVDGNDF